MNLSDWSSLSENLQRELIVKWYRESREDLQSHEYMDMAEEAARALKHELRFNGDVANVRVGGGAIICHLGPRWPVIELTLDVCTLLPEHQAVENLPDRYCGFRVAQLNLRERMDSFLKTLVVVMAELKGWTEADTFKWANEHPNEPLTVSLSGGFLFEPAYSRGPLALAAWALTEAYIRDSPCLKRRNSGDLSRSIRSVISDAAEEARSLEHYHPDKMRNLDWDSVRMELKDLIEREKLLGEASEPK